MRVSDYCHFLTLGLDNHVFSGLTRRLLRSRCYWWPIAQEGEEMGVNTRNVDPERMRLVEHRITYQWITAPLNDPKAAHPDDKAKYGTDVSVENLKLT